MKNCKFLLISLILAIGLLTLGATNSEAQTVYLTLDKSEVNDILPEDETYVEIVVTATNRLDGPYSSPVDAEEDINIVLFAKDITADIASPVEIRSDHLRIEGLGTLIIPDGSSTATKTIKVYPADIPAVDGSRRIRIDYQGSPSVPQTYADFKVIDNESEDLRISFVPSTTTINSSSEVDIKLDVRSSGPLPIDIKLFVTDVSSGFKSLKESDIDDTFFDNYLSSQFGSTIGLTSEYLSRDTDYNLISGFNTLDFKKGDSGTLGSFTVRLEIKDKTDGKYLVIGNPDFEFDVGVGDRTDPDYVTDLIDVVPAVLRVVKNTNLDLTSVSLNGLIFEHIEGPQELEVEIETRGSAPRGGHTVNLEIVEIEGRRDVDYDLELDAQVVIPAGSRRARTSITITVPDNEEISPISFEIRAQSDLMESSEVSETLNVIDNESETTEIKLIVDKEFIEEVGDSEEVTVTAYLVGSPFNEDVEIILLVDDKSSATRDSDYSVSLNRITIPAGDLSASETIVVTPLQDQIRDRNEEIFIGSLDDHVTVDGKEIDVEPARIILIDGIAKPEIPEAIIPVTLDDENSVLQVSIGEQINWQLPEGTLDPSTSSVSYSVSGLPVGLNFNSSTRRLTGSVDSPGEFELTYFAVAGSYATQFSYTLVVTNVLQSPVVIEHLNLSSSSIHENSQEGSYIDVHLRLEEVAEFQTTISLSLVSPRDNPAKRDIDFNLKWNTSRIVIPAGEIEASSRLYIEPRDNSDKGDKYVRIVATSRSGDTATALIKIIDDDGDSKSLSVNSDVTTFSEGSSSDVNVRIKTSVISTKVTPINIKIDELNSSSSRDIDYNLSFNKISPKFVIEAGSSFVDVGFKLSVNADDSEESDESLVLVVSSPGFASTSLYLVITDSITPVEPADSEEEIVEEVVEEIVEEVIEEIKLSFSFDIPDQAYTEGTSIKALALPDVIGGAGDIEYQVFELPSGLTFDSESRTISGTPDLAGSFEVIVLASDSNGNSIVLDFNIVVNLSLSFGDAFGSGKIIPDSGELSYFADLNSSSLILPGVVGGSDPITFEFQPQLPLGVDFDFSNSLLLGVDNLKEDTRYIVKDSQGSSISLLIRVTPSVIVLENNFPNPFNPSTTINYSIPHNSNVELIVYNITGQPVSKLVSERQDPGFYSVEWNALDSHGHYLSSGIYFYRLKVNDDFLEVKKMMLVK